MKTVYDLSALDGVLEDCLPKIHKEIEEKIKEYIKKNLRASFLEYFVSIPISGNSQDARAFECVVGEITVHLKRIYSTKTWKPIKDIYSVDGYTISYLHRKNIWDNYKSEIIEKHLFPHWERPEHVDDTGKPC